MKNNLISSYLMLFLFSLSLPEIYLYGQSVTLLDFQHKNIFGIPSIVYRFEINDQNIASRIVKVNAYTPNNPIGAVILTTGGFGQNYYSEAYGVEAEKTIDSLFNHNLEIYEIKWEGEKGWGTNARGCGYHIAVSAYSTLVKYLQQNLFVNKETIIAHGNSGGSFQIAYGLAIYDLDTIIDMAVLSGGPPVSDLKTGIFGEPWHPAYWPDGLSGFAITDFMMGWDGNGDYCVNRTAPDSIKIQLDTVSLVTDKHPRVFNYETYLNFVQSNDPTNADHQAELFFNAVSSEKEWFQLDDVNIHELPESSIASEKIRTLIIDFAENGNTTGFSESDSIFNLNINKNFALSQNYPNPFNPSTVIKFALPIDGSVSIRIYNIVGEEVMSVSSVNYSAGVHEFEFNGTEISSGVYFYTIQVEGIDGSVYNEVKKMMMLK